MADKGRVLNRRNPLARLPAVSLLSWSVAVTGASALDTTGVALPPPPATGERSLEYALWHRRSGRDFQTAALNLDELARLAWSAQGMSAASRRTAPSAGALYPLTLYLDIAEADGLTPGVYRYSPERHHLEPIAKAPHGGRQLAATSGQKWLGRAPVIFAIAGTVDRTVLRYGKRAERYVHMEAGHAAQNLLLQATGLGLCATSVASFDDAAVARVLHLSSRDTPLYLIPAGRCAAEP